MMPGRLGPEHFHSLHRHGFVRVATSTPRVRPPTSPSTATPSSRRRGGRDAARRRPRGLPGALRLLLRHRRPAPADGPARRGRGRRSATSSPRAPSWRRCCSSARRSATTGRLYNCALAIARGAPPRRGSEVLPARTTASTTRSAGSRTGATSPGRRSRVAGREAPFGSDLLFEATRPAGLRLPCRDLRGFLGADPALDSAAALAGATILANLSASNITIGKADERHMLCRSQSARAVAAYLYSAAGPGESTTDLAWDGQGAIYELGDLLAESERFPAEPQLCPSPTSTPAASSAERMRTRTFNDAAEARRAPERPFRRDRASSTAPHFEDVGLIRADPALPLRARTGRTASTRTATRPSTSRSRACAAASRSTQRRPHGDRRLRAGSTRPTR